MCSSGPSQILHKTEGSCTGARNPNAGRTSQQSPECCVQTLTGMEVEQVIRSDAEKTQEDFHEREAH